MMEALVATAIAAADDNGGGSEVALWFQGIGSIAAAVFVGIQLWIYRRDRLDELASRVSGVRLIADEGEIVVRNHSVDAISAVKVDWPSSSSGEHRTRDGRGEASFIPAGQDALILENGPGAIEAELIAGSEWTIEFVSIGGAWRVQNDGSRPKRLKSGER